MRHSVSAIVSGLRMRGILLPTAPPASCPGGGEASFDCR